MGFDGQGKSVPASEGTDYGAVVLDQAGEPEVVASGTVEGDTIALRALSDNTGNIYIGWDDDVDQTNGLPLASGQGISIDIDNEEQQVFAVAPNANDELRYLLMK